MTDNVEDLIASVSINQVLVSILEEHGKLIVPTLKFLDAGKSEKELVVDYDKSISSFIFSLRDKVEQQ
jgi:hypothetical protein